jgi:hypothetical protein
MTTRAPIDLSAHINSSVTSGGPADFPVVLKPVMYERNGTLDRIPKRFAVVRDDTGESVAVVSDRYTLVPHQRILSAVEQAISDLDVGPVPHGIYMDKRGARMRALFKFPALEQGVTMDDRICPCLKVQNTYDGTSRIALHIGAFRFVCTNLAVGGGGVFAGGFMAVHAGEIAIEKVAEQLASYLSEFPKLVALYRRWSDQAVSVEEMNESIEALPPNAGRYLSERVAEGHIRTVYDGYNDATWFATHQMRSARAAFELLERINREFQGRFRPSRN